MYVSLLAATCYKLPHMIMYMHLQNKSNQLLVSQTNILCKWAQPIWHNMRTSRLSRLISFAANIIHNQKLWITALLGYVFSYKTYIIVTFSGLHSILYTVYLHPIEAILCCPFPWLYQIVLWSTVVLHI